MYAPYYGGGGFNPYLHSSYLPERQYYPGYGRPAYDPYAEARARAQAEARARALAEQRARRAQWLPDEDDDYDDWEYAQLGPRERAYLEARKRQQQLERAQQERARIEAERKRLEEERWQKQLEERQREEDARRERLLEEQRRIQAQKREQARRQAEALNQAQESGQHRTPSSPHRIPISEGTQRSRSRSRTPAPQNRTQPRSPVPPQASPPPRQPTPRPQYTEKHEQAASTIQNHYRIHKALKSIRDYEQSFKDAKKKFVFPSILDFQRPGASSDHDHISVPVRSPPPPEGDPNDSSMDVDEPTSGKLAYTSNNYNFHAYTENLLKLLMQLDGVESWGDANVRKRRRAVVKEIEAEVSRVDAYWKKAWRDYLREEEEKKAQKKEDDVRQEVESWEKEKESAQTNESHEEEKREGSEEKMDTDAP